MNRLLAFVLATSVYLGAVAAKTTPSNTTKKKTTKTKTAIKKKTASAKVVASKTADKKKRVRTDSASAFWRSPTFADSTAGDNVDGEDLTVRRAAVAALGPLNGSIVVSEAGTGRILTIVNQKLALHSGFIPCSTVKLMTTFAALSENMCDPMAHFRINRRLSYDLTDALAHSNNQYFAALGVKLGFKKVSYYARLFGFGEKAGLNIPGEQAGVVPDEPPANGGVGMMTSFGEGISLTPLELTAMLGAIANGGTLHYLQYPRSDAEIEQYVPRIKRRLDIANLIPMVKPGMKAVTERGTGRRAAYDTNEPIMGKTGTCTDFRQGSHMGWFGSFNEVGNHKLVVVVMLTGAKAVSGPIAAGVAGGVYKGLSEQRFFAKLGTSTPMDLVSTQSCCR